MATTFPLMMSLIFISTTNSLVDDQHYCGLRYKRLCMGKGRHIACQFHTSGPGFSCLNYTQIKFTSDLRHFIIHYINRRRQRIAAGTERVRGGAHLPKPELMMMVEWDRELSFLAQRLADQCRFVHDDCRATVRYPYAGQTVGEVKWRRSSESDQLSAQRAIRRVFDAWWGERRRVQARQLTSPFKLTTKGSVWGHFSQLSVWTLRAVGCGAVRHGPNYPRLLLVCDFSHTNMLGQPTISPGPLAACPLHTARRPRSPYPLLCAPVRYPTQSQDLDERSIYENMYEDYDFEDEEDQESRINVTTLMVELKTRWPDALKSSTKRYTITEMRKEYTTQKTVRHDMALRTRGIDRNKYTKGFMIDKLEQELEEVRKIPELRMTFDKRPDKPVQITENWRISKIQSRYKDNSDPDVIMAQYPRKQFTKVFEIDDHNVVQYYRPTIFAVTQTESEDQKNVPRHRWKATRRRPQRPGANALLGISSGRVLERPSISSMKLDNDDVDQLFRDTGFNVNWRKNKDAKQ